jgi:RAB protein geranylgeranyltransferase component A
MFTVAVLAKEKSKELADGFGFVKCVCGECFPFDFEARENCRKSGKVMLLVCPKCKTESNKVVAPRYTDPNGVEHGQRTYHLVYLDKKCPV